MHRIRSCGLNIFGLLATLEHGAYLFPCLEEWRVATSLGKEGIEVLVLSAEIVNKREEEIGQLGIELGAASISNLLKRTVDRPCGCIGATVGEGVEDIG